MSMFNLKDFNTSSYTKLLNHISSVYGRVDPNMKTKVFTTMSEYGERHHEIAKGIYNVKGDFETKTFLYQKYAKKLQSFEGMQAIYYMICWFSDFKEREQTMKVLEYGFNGINGWAI